MSPGRRIELGPVPVDGVTLAEALDAIEELVRAGRGGTVFTPNVDHVVIADQDGRLRAAYGRVSLSLPDGVPILWAARLLRTPLPEKVSGSDLVEPLLARAAQRGWRVFFLGGAPGVAALARDRLRSRMPDLKVVGVLAPDIGQQPSASEHRDVVAPIRSTAPHLVLVALGAPKQELWIDRCCDELRPAVLLGIGASLDFIAGTVPRAPRWMSRSGLEWLYRLSREPRRLWRRYLVRDPRFLWIVGRELTSRRAPGRPAADREP